jgi:hypothetical protein
MNKLAWVVVALAVVAVLAVALPAICQQAPPPGGDVPGAQGMRGPGGPPPTPALVVTEKGLYVMAGPQIFRLDPETLKVLAQAELPRPERPAGQEAPPAAGAAGAVPPG